MIELSEFALENVFNKIVTKDGDFIYWRDCILRDDMKPGEQGYIIVFANGDCHHTYRPPTDWIY